MKEREKKLRKPPKDRRYEENDQDRRARRPPERVGTRDLSFRKQGEKRKNRKCQAKDKCQFGNIGFQEGQMESLFDQERYEEQTEQKRQKKLRNSEKGGREI